MDIGIGRLLFRDDPELIFQVRAGIIPDTITIGGKTYYLQAHGEETAVYAETEDDSG